MTPAELLKKWKPVSLTERAAAHTRFLDLCKLFEHEDPVSSDPTGEWFTFEKGVTKTGGGEGFADVWKKNSFAWEYKKKKRDLNTTMDQLVRYAAALENPPLQVVKSYVLQSSVMLWSYRRWQRILCFDGKIGANYPLSRIEFFPGSVRRSYLTGF